MIFRASKSSLTVSPYQLTFPVNLFSRFLFKLFEQFGVSQLLLPQRGEDRLFHQLVFILG